MENKKPIRPVTDLEEYKKNIRPCNESKEEPLTELEYCRRYSKTRSMGQD